MEFWRWQTGGFFVMDYGKKLQHLINTFFFKEKINVFHKFKVVIYNYFVLALISCQIWL